MVQHVSTQKNIGQETWFSLLSYISLDVTSIFLVQFVSVIFEILKACLSVFHPNIDTHTHKHTNTQTQMYVWRATGTHVGLLFPTLSSPQNMYAAVSFHRSFSAYVDTSMTRTYWSVSCGDLPVCLPVSACLNIQISQNWIHSSDIIACRKKSE